MSQVTKFSDGKEHLFNYGRLYNLFKNDHTKWTKGKNYGWVSGHGPCFCLSYALFHYYRLTYGKDEQIIIEARARLLQAIKELFPDRVSVSAQKFFNANEPMNLERQYSLVSFNDHPDTTVDDIIAVCERARV